jgi:hypothetical protein
MVFKSTFPPRVKDALQIGCGEVAPRGVGFHIALDSFDTDIAAGRPHTVRAVHMRDVDVATGCVEIQRCAYRNGDDEIERGRRPSPSFVALALDIGQNRVITLDDVDVHIIQGLPALEETESFAHEQINLDLVTFRSSDRDVAGRGFHPDHDARFDGEFSGLEWCVLSGHRGGEHQKA